jgi:hypothetical protein
MLSPQWVFYNATYLTSQAYKQYMDAQRALGIEPNFPRNSNWSFVPGMDRVRTWTQQIFQALWDVQHMSSTPTPYWLDGNQQVEFNCMGMFHTYEKYGGKISGRDQWIRSLFPVLVHFAHLYDTSFLRLSRTRVQAAFRGRFLGPSDPFVYSFTEPNSVFKKMSVGTSIGSWAISEAAVVASFMLRSESILRTRGDWSDGIDRVNKTDLVNGTLTNEFLLEVSKNVSQAFLNAHRKYGLSEYQTDYVQQNDWGLDLLPVAMTYVSGATNARVFVFSA